MGKYIHRATGAEHSNVTVGMDLTGKFSFVPPLPLEKDAHLSRKMLTGMITYTWSGCKWS